jgi:CRP-like cAMP-binding protein
MQPPLVIPYPSGKRLIHTGTIPDYYFLIKDGVFRKGSYSGDTLKTLDIYISGDVIFPETCLDGTVPVPYFIETLNSGIVEKYWKRELEDMSFSTFKVLMSKVLSQKERLSNLYLENAAKRYQLFLEQYGSYSAYIPLKVVASYLNIDPATLSKVRKSLTKSN